MEYSHNVKISKKKSNTEKNINPKNIRPNYNLQNPPKNNN